MRPVQAGHYPHAPLRQIRTGDQSPRSAVDKLSQAPHTVSTLCPGATS
jgi:hypothetical protein